MPVFLFTDIEGSTQLWEKHPSVMNSVLKRHNAIIQNSVENHGGLLVKFTGDGVFAVFENDEAIACSMEIQRVLNEAVWDEIGELRVRIGLHAGEVEIQSGDYYGPAVNRAARVMSAAWGEQILLTQEAKAAARLPETAGIQDLGAHVLKDLGEPIRLFMLSDPNIERQFPPPRTLSAQPNNLPAQTTPFIGRQREIKSITSMVGRDCRVLTILGPGGMGKTRLGLQSAAEQIEAHSDGVYFVPLAPLSSAEAIVSTLAKAINYSFSNRGDPQEQLLHHLQPKQMLLIMDNFEHVTEGAGFLADIVTRAPDVHVIATSRTRLNVAVECVYEIEGLKMPAALTDEVFEAFEAVELFLTYARRSKPDFVVDEDERAAILKICRLVGGMPLALELAASWIRVLPPSEIVREVGEDPDFLSADRADTPERQKSMRATFDYSWKLLSQDEQNVLMKMSVFRGGFSRQAGKKITSATLSVLTGLVDKSLVKWRTSENRYEVHELIRQFCEQALEESGKSTEIKQLHSNYYLDALAKQLNNLKGGAQAAALYDISQDFENVRAAWNWALVQQNWQLMDRAVESLFLFFFMRALPKDAAPLLESLRSALLNRNDPAEQVIWARATSFSYSLAYQSANSFEVQYKDLESALDIVDQHGTILDKALCLYALGVICATLDLDWERAASYAHQSLNAFQNAEDLFYIGRVHGRVGYYSAWFLEDYSNVFLKETEQSLEIAQQFNDIYSIGQAETNLAVHYFYHGDFEQASRRCFLALKAFEKLGSRELLAFTTALVGALYFMKGELEAAKEYLLVSEAEIRKANFVAEVYGLGIRAALECVEGRPHSGKKFAKKSIHTKSNPIGLALGYWGLSMACIGLHEYDSARKAILIGINFEPSIDNVFSLNFLPCAAVLLSEEGLLDWAVEVLSLAFNEPRSATGWLEKWSVISELQENLIFELGAEIYQAAWERGKTLDLPSVGQYLVEHFKK